MTYTKEELAQVKDLNFEEYRYGKFIAHTPFCNLKMIKNPFGSTGKKNSHEYYFSCEEGNEIGYTEIIPSFDIVRSSNKYAIDYITKLYKERVLDLRSRVIEAINV